LRGSRIEPQIIIYVQFNTNDSSLRLYCPDPTEVYYTRLLDSGGEKLRRVLSDESLANNLQAKPRSATGPQADPTDGRSSS
jgi:hypothetical protein